MAPERVEVLVGIDGDDVMAGDASHLRTKGPEHDLRVRPRPPRGCASVSPRPGAPIGCRRLSTACGKGALQCVHRQRARSMGAEPHATKRAGACEGRPRHAAPARASRLPPRHEGRAATRLDEAPRSSLEFVPRRGRRRRSRARAARAAPRRARSSWFCPTRG